MTKEIVEALQANYMAKKLSAIANLKNYLENPAGIGEHPDIVSECDKLVKEIASANEGLETLKGLFENQQPQDSKE
tara:strand:+ start:10377 stop:10604 length:228 start_codon:yes stop_codon:yes gene_type:complete